MQIKGKLEFKKDFQLVILIGIITFSLLNNVMASQTSVSDAGVEYDNELKGQFLLNKWVYVTVDIKDTSNITIPNRNSPDFESKLSERKAIMTTINEAVLATLSEDEFKLKTKSEFGGFFSGNITKEGFDKLLKDERVDHIYAEKYIESHSLAFFKNFWIIFLIIFIVSLIILIILIIKIKKRKWKIKR